MAKPALVPDLPEPVHLSRFEGMEVLSTTAAIRKAGDGLSAAVKVDPVELHHGETVYVVLETTVEKIRHDPVKDTDGLQRVHLLVTNAATIVDAGLVADYLEQQKERIEKAAGIARLPFGDGTTDPDADPLGVFDEDGDSE